MSERPRTVYDGHASWRCRIIEGKNWRGQQAWKWVLDRQFVEWRYGEHMRFFWCSNHARVQHEAQAELDRRDHSRIRREGRYVGVRDHE